MKQPQNSADRMRQLRQRAASLLAEPAAIPLAYRASLPGTLALLAGELLKRTGSNVTVTIPPP